MGILDGFMSCYEVKRDEEEEMAGREYSMTKDKNIEAYNLNGKHLMQV